MIQDTINQKAVRLEEIESNRTADCKVYRMSDGSRQAVFFDTDADGIAPASQTQQGSSLHIYQWTGGKLTSSDSGTYTVSGGTEQSGKSRIYMGFTMPALPRNPRIKRAELTVTQSSAHTATRLALYRTTLPAEGGDAPEHGAILDYVKVSEEQQTYRFDITALMGISEDVGLVLQLLDESEEAQVTLGSPTVSITFESGYGMDGQQTQTHELGRFGQGSVDLTRGNLLFECQDFAWGGSRMPVTVRHLYNSALSDCAYSANAAICLNVADYSAMKLGLGWRLDLLQSMVSGTFVHEGVSQEGYIHTDENGEETFYKVREDGKFESVDDAEAIYDATARTLTVGEETQLFDESGRLIRKTDAYGNTLELEYVDGRLVCVTDGIQRSFSFTYGADDLLTAITAPDGTAISYAYTDELLTCVTYPDGRKAEIAYTETRPTAVTLYDSEGRVVYKLAYAFSGDKVRQVSEYGVENGAFVTGAVTEFEYSISANRTVTKTVQGDEPTVYTAYTFDHEGNTVSEYTYGMDGDTIQPYAGENGVNTFGTSRNLLKNHNVENNGFWDPLESNAKDFTRKLDNKAPILYGTNALHLSSPNASYLGNGLEQKVTAAAGEYTLSGYFLTQEGITGGETPGAYIRVVDATGAVVAETDHICGKSTEYVRVVTHFALAEEKELSVQILLDGMGTAYASAFQLENNPFLSAYNLLQNGTCEQNGYWTWNDGKAANPDGTLVFEGDLEKEQHVFQYVPVHSAKAVRETFTLSGWAKGCGLPAVEREGMELPRYRLRAVIEYTPNYKETPETETFTADFNPNAEDWQYVCVQFAKSKYQKVSKLTVYCDFDHNMGTVKFDDIQLIRDRLETDLTEDDFEEEETTGETEETGSVAPSTEEETAAFEELLDAFGNSLTETTYSDTEYGTVYRSFGYGTDGNDLLWEKDARGEMTTYSVDPHTSRNKTVTDRCGNMTDYEYDEAGRTTKVTSKDYSGKQLANVSYAYDAFDNLSEIVRGDGLKYALGYNAFHNLEAIGVEGKTESLVKYTYKSGNGRLKAVTYANGDTMKVTYNQYGQMTGEKWYDGANNLTAHYQYAYDGEGNIIRSVDFLAQKEYTYSYREGTLIRAKEYAITVENGIIIGRTVVTTVSYTYNADGALTKKQFTSGKTEWTVNYENPEEGSPIVRFVANGKTITSRSKTDSFGRKTFEELQLGSTFISRQFAYHEGKITTEHSENDKVKSAPTTQLVSKITLSDGRTLSYSYDEEERITCVTETSENGDRPAYTTEYTYDAMGQLLTEVVNGELVNEMTYDGYGNILTKNGKIYTYGDPVWKDKLTAIDNQPIVYDAQGNPTTYLGYALTWEKGRQLKTFGTNSYTYNANGIRTGKTVNGVTHTYTLDGTNILCETWENNTLIPLRDNEDQVCGILHNGTPYYFLKNLQGDIIAIQDSNAQTVARYTYDAWGVCTITEDTTDATIATINPYRYRGYYYDTEIGMYYLQSRYYDPATGRFVNGDSPNCIETGTISTSCNLFTYCENDAIDLKDILGGFSWSIFPTVINFLSGVASKLGDFLLGVYGISQRKYAHKLKYKNASSLTQFVNNNKKKLKKFTRGFSGVASCLEIIMIATECYNRIKTHSGTSVLKTVASLAFYGVVSVLGELVSKLVSWIISKLIAALFWARFIIELILDTLIDWVLGRPWVEKLENKFVASVNSYKMNIGNYIIALFKAAKAAFA